SVVGGITADLVSLRFRAAGVVQQDGIEAEAESELSELAGTKGTAQNCDRELGQGNLGSAVRAMTHHDVAFLVGNYSGELSLALRGLNRGAVHINKSSRQGEGINVAAVHHFECPWVVVAIGRDG